MTRPLALVALLAFGTLSAWAVAAVGYFGILEYHLKNPGGIQVLVDLVLACTISMAMIVADARRRGSNPWPYVALTLPLGSIGLLAYFAFGRGSAKRSA